MIVSIVSIVSIAFYFYFFLYRTFVHEPADRLFSICWAKIHWPENNFSLRIFLFSACVRLLMLLLLWKCVSTEFMHKKNTHGLASTENCVYSTRDTNANWTQKTYSRSHTEYCCCWFFSLLFSLVRADSVVSFSLSLSLFRSVGRSFVSLWLRCELVWSVLLRCRY